MRKIGLPTILVLAVCVAACGDDLSPNISGVPGYAIASVHVVPEIDTIVIGDVLDETDQLQLTAVALSRTLTEISGMQFVWSSSDETVATVDGSGLVMPVSPGSAYITASAAKTGRALVVVKYVPDVIPVP